MSKFENLISQGYILHIEGMEVTCFTIIPNTQYEIVVNGVAMYYEGSLEDLDRLDQLEVWEKETLI